jgi:hypothetical protein
MCAHRRSPLDVVPDHDNQVRVYDRNVLLIEMSAKKTLVFRGLTSWHCDCNVPSRLLKTPRRALSSLPGIRAAMGRP